MPYFGKRLDSVSQTIRLNLTPNGEDARPYRLSSDVSVANSPSRGDREFEMATAMLFPGEMAQRGRMHDHIAAHFRRRVSL